MKSKTVGVLQAREEIAVVVEGGHIYISASFLDRDASTIRIPVDSLDALVHLLALAREVEEDA